VIGYFHSCVGYNDGECHCFDSTPIAWQTAEDGSLINLLVRNGDRYHKFPNETESTYHHEIVGVFLLKYVNTTYGPTILETG
jgi:hypothetical protein